MSDLDFLFKLDAKIDGQLKMLEAVDKSITKLHELDKATSTTEKETSKLSKASHGAAVAHDKHARATLNLGHAYEKSKDHVVGFAEAMGLVLAFEAVEKLTEKVMELGGEIVTAAAGAERTGKSFELLLGAKGAEETLGWVEGIAKYTEFTDDHLKSAASSLLQVGLRGDALKKAMAGALDIAALPGGSLDEAIGAMERISRTGKVDNRVLGGLGFGEKDFLGALSKRTGKPAAVLKDEMEKGKVDAANSMDSLFDLIHARTGKELGAAGVEMSKSMGARLTHLKDLPDQFFQGLAKTEGFQRLSDQVGKLLEAFDPDSARGKKIFANLDKAFSGFVDMMSKANIEKFADTTIELFTDLPPLIDAVVKALEGVAWLGKAVGETAGKLYLSGAVTATESGADDPARIAGRLKHQREEPSPYKDGAAIHDVVAEARAERLARKLGQSNSKGLADGMVGGKADVTAAGEDLAAAAHGATKEKLDIHSPSKVFEDLGRMSAAGYDKGLELSAPVLPDWIGPVPSRAAGMGGARVIVQAGAVHISATLHAGPGAAPSAEQLGDQLAARVEELLPSALQSAFEKMQIEAGA